MDISVILTTARFGGLDILFSSMLAQEFDGDFEIIVSDEFYQERNPYWLGRKFKYRQYRNLTFTHFMPKHPCRI